MIVDIIVFQHAMAVVIEVDPNLFKEIKTRKMM